MNQAAGGWSHLSERLRRAMGLCPPTPAEADEAMRSAGEVPMSDEEIAGIVRQAVQGETPAAELDRAWDQDQIEDAFASNLLVMNRNPGGRDDEVDRRLERLRRQIQQHPSPPRTRVQWLAHQGRLEKARAAAEELVESVGHSVPVDPLAIAAGEGSMLRCVGDDFRDRFDGQLEYHRRERAFVLLYNTKYDTGLPADEHHPRTRFSIAHELGHYFLEHHRKEFLAGATPHGSKSECFADEEMEREADSFASGLLMPTKLARSLVNEGELSVPAIERIASHFRVSMLSAALRSVQISDYPCAVVGLRGGVVAWSFCSKPLDEAGMYPPARGSSGSTTARLRWAGFGKGDCAMESSATVANQWFRTFDNPAPEGLHVDEHYIPVPILGTLVVLLSVPEDQLGNGEDEEE